MPTTTKTAAKKTIAKKTSTAPAKRPPGKTTPRTPAAADAPVAAGKPVKDKRATAPAGKAPKPKRIALVRDGFTMPEADFALIATLKTRALASRREAKKSELLRAGLQALAQLDGDALVQALNRLQPVKTGRPKKAH